MKKDIENLEIKEQLIDSDNETNPNHNSEKEQQSEEVTELSFRDLIKYLPHWIYEVLKVYFNGLCIGVLILCSSNYFFDKNFWNIEAKYVAFAMILFATISSCSLKKSKSSWWLPSVLTAFFYGVILLQNEVIIICYFLLAIFILTFESTDIYPKLRKLLKCSLIPLGIVISIGLIFINVNKTQKILTNEEWKSYYASINEIEDKHKANIDSRELVKYYREVFKKLETWDNSDNNREDILVSLFAVELECLGVEHERLTIVTIEDEAKKTSAYNDIEKVIIINSLYLPHADLEEALQETLHTAFLAYEHYICDNLDYSHRLTYSPFYERALSWKDVLDNPYSQYIGDSRETEIDARLYSIDRLEIYKKAFDIYLEEEMERNEEFNKYNSSAETDTNDEF